MFDKKTAEGVDLRLSRLRKYMKLHRFDYYIVFTSDPHLSEYISETDKLREYLTGFTGSAGTLVVSESDAYLWVDGRYYIQAENETRGSWIRIMKQGEKDVPQVSDFLLEKCKKSGGATIGFDGRYISAAGLKSLKEKLPDNVDLDSNAIIEEKFWPEREPRIFNPIRVIDNDHSGKTVSEKMSELRGKVAKEVEEDYCYIVSDLCSVMWLTNLRGEDISYVPVAFSYMTIFKDRAVIFLDKSAVNNNIQSHLDEALIEVIDYSLFYDEIANIKNSNILVDITRNNGLIYELIKDSNSVKEVSDSCFIRKDIKNSTEIEFFRKYHIVDAVSMIRFMIRLEAEMEKDRDDFSECDAAQIMDEIRLSASDCCGLSFDTISAYGKNAALPHYSAKKNSCSVIEKHGLYLIDCGGHYPSCTTDITRTIALGSLTDKEKEYYTLVLKGNLALMNAVFMDGTRGENLDILARGPIWRSFLDFRHGTGHGIGCELSVHEGPTAIRYRISKDYEQLKLEPGMVLSDEPGIYIEGEFGVRLENELLIVEKAMNEWGRFMGFESLTLVPFDKNAVNISMLDDTELEYLNNYHSDVYEKVSPYLEEPEKKWLAEKTSKIVR